jgi:hypothetical protein
MGGGRRLVVQIAPALLLVTGCGGSDAPAPAPDPVAAPATSAAPAVADPAVHFRLVDEAAQRGLIWVNHCGEPVAKRYVLEEVGQGCALFDVEGDGDLDAYLVDACGLVAPTDPDAPWTPSLDGQCRLYENDGHGRFRDVTEESGAGLRVFGQGVVAADYDGDGDVDLYVTCWGPTGRQGTRTSPT